METKEFEYFLPEELIAQTPIEPRDEARLLVIEREKGEVKEDIFKNIVNYFNKGDVLVLNDTKVLHCRIFARKNTGGKVELLLLKEIEKGVWEALVKPQRRVSIGTELLVEGEKIKIGERTEEGSRIVFFSSNTDVGELMDKFGKVPIPPYIKKELKEPSRYQTVFAKNPGSVAAPTAALHFTPSLLDEIKEKGVDIVYITLHLGWASFRLIKKEKIEDHKLLPEYCQIKEEVAEKINKAKGKGRIFACGTDVVRTLEGCAENGKLKPFSGNVSLYIKPGYEFKVVDALITNLHLPRSSHLVLVCSFAQKELIFRAYEFAIKRKFRFYTFGDATLII